MLARRWIVTSLMGLLACSSEGKKTDSISLQAKLDSTQARLDSAKRFEQQRVADSIRREQATPRRLSLIGDTLRIAAPSGQTPGFSMIGFSLPTPGKCKVTGRIEVVAGGNKDLLVALFRHDDFVNWRNNPQARGRTLFWAGPQTVTTLDVAIPDTGTFDLVLSNRFSTVTSKTAIGNAEVVCIGSPVPIAAKAG